MGVPKMCRTCTFYQCNGMKCVVDPRASRIRRPESKCNGYIMDESWALKKEQLVKPIVRKERMKKPKAEEPTVE